MNDLTKYQPPMPATVKRQMDARLTNIFQIAAAAKVAMDVQASVYRFGWFTLISEANQASFTLQAYQMNHPGGHADIAYQEWVTDLEMKFNRLYSLLGEKLVQIIEEIPVETRPVGFLEEIANQLYNFFFGEDNSPDTTLDQMHQLEMHAKSAFTNTAAKHANNFPEYLNRAQMRNEEFEYDPQER